MGNENSKNDDNEQSSLGIAYGIGLGMLFGVAVGAATDDYATWISIGSCFGVAIGFLAGQIKSDDKTHHKENGTQEPDSKD
jgi:hypothetical protein